MPIMPRVKGKAQKIAYKLLGTPINMRGKVNYTNTKIKARLAFENSRLVR